MSAKTMKQAAMISAWIEANPRRPEVEQARIKGTGIPVWALVGYLDAVLGDPARVAEDYGLPLEAVNAALAYYAQHRAAIDTRLAANAASVS
ncbi:MAG: DUF433 domain-containing protein [Dehalococcoidia bacterium]